MNQSIADLESAVNPGLLRRLAAILYDTVLVSGVVMAGFTIAYLPLAILLNLTEIGTHFLFKPYLLALAVGFHVWFWTHGGQTLGMRAWRLKVYRNDGGDLTVKDALIRYAVAILSATALGIGFLWALFDPDKRTWHDIASNTRLVLTAKQR